MRDVWIHTALKPINFAEAAQRFGLEDNEETQWSALQDTMAIIGSRFFIQQNNQPQATDWVGIFNNWSDDLPVVIIQGVDITSGSLERIHQQLFSVKEGGGLWKVQPASKAVTRIAAAGASHSVTGFPERVRIAPTSKKQGKIPTLLYFGKVRDLSFDPFRVQWNGDINFFQYTTKIGRQLLSDRHPPIQLAVSKWYGILDENFRFNWRNIWDPQRVNKEAMLIWQVWHRLSL